ncbi:hypothetical protein CHUAL_007601 [Chamberlinius hualienensis]
MCDSKFIIKIRKCFQLLFEHDHRVTDDTLLEKFSLLLEQIFKANDADSGDVIQRGIDLNKWLNVFAARWKVLDSSVVALGLNVIGSLPICSYGLDALQINREIIKDLLKSIHSTPQLNSSISCSLWKLFLKLVEISSEEAWLPQDCLRSCILSIDDDSMYVSRAATELAVRLIIKNCNEETTRHAVLQFVSDIQKSNETKLVRKALDVLLHLSRDAKSTQLWDTEMLNQLHPVLLATMQTSDDEKIISNCATLYLNSKLWPNFELERDEIWLSIFNTLCEKSFILCSSKFIVSSLELISSREKNSHNLVSMLIYPLYLCGERPTDYLWPWSFDGLSSNIMEKMKVICSNSRSTTKLLCFIISSLTIVHSCFVTNESRLSLTKVLIELMSANQPISHLQKVSQVAADSLIRLLELWGDNWMRNLTSADQNMLLINSVMLLSRRPTPVAMSVRLTKLVAEILKKLCTNLRHVWNVVESQLKETMELSFCDPQWEIRDNAFELLSEIAKLSKDEEFLRNWLKESKLVDLCVLAFEDQQDYVKASAISVLSSIPEIGSKVKFDLVENMGKILLFDSEGIVRRAAARNFQSWMASSYLECENLELAYKCMVQCCYDLDWEVKLSAVQFWSTVLSLFEPNPESDPKNILEALVKCGFCSAVHVLAGDEDNSVRMEVAKLMVKLTELISPAVFTDYVGSTDVLTNAEVAEPVIIVPKITNETTSSGPVDESVIESVLDTIDNIVMQSKMVSFTDTKETKSLKDVLAAVNLTFPNQFLNRLQGVVSRASGHCVTTDLYDINPEALLDDILITNYESDHDEDIVIDCY